MISEKTHRATTIAVCIIIAWLGAWGPVTAQAADRPIRVTFLTPSPTSTRPFWRDYVAFMKVAATSLGMDLTVVEATNRFEVVDNAAVAISSTQPPDYLVYIYHAETTLTILQLTEKTGIKSLIVNTGVVPQEKATAGAPREKYPLWIGHITPDDFLASRQLAQRLIDRATQLGLYAQDNALHMIGVGGDLLATASMYREDGLRSVLGDNPDVILERFVRANWSREIARDKTLKLLTMYPDVSVCWAVHDNTARGVIEAIKESGAVPGKDILTGGIDWSREGIEAVRRGDMEASIGGHFMGGGWALILIYDYAHGIDFASTGVVIKSQMRLIDQNSLQHYLPAIEARNWQQIDFKRFSKSGNPDLIDYDFSPDAVVKALKR